MSTVTKKYPEYEIISLVSRMSLADSHITEFELVNYRTTTNHGLNEVYQLDSLDKVDNLNKPFILLIDEIASLCSHFLNTMKKMSNNRIPFVEIFAK